MEFTIGDLVLTDEHFSTQVSMVMPTAMALLIGRLGARFFLFDEQANQYVPSPEALQICRVVEGGNEEAATTLAAAVKAAYDVYVKSPNPPAGAEVGKPVP